MSLPNAILELENRFVADECEPTLGDALLVGIDEWRSGNRDRELRLHLLFLAWYCNLEPPHITGLNESVLSSSELPSLFQDVYETFAAGIQDDVESLYVIGLMALLTPWLLGEDSKTWEARSDVFRRRYRELLPNGLAPAQFEGRGAFGDYFADQLGVGGGY